MDVAMMQPAFMPWQGYFELIYRSEIFIFLDDFQFSVQSYHQRNRLFINSGRVGWCTVPVDKKLSFKEPLNRARINEQTGWRSKMWISIESNYRKAAYFKDFSPILKEWLAEKQGSLSDLNMSFIKKICDLLGLKREFRLSSERPTSLKRSQRVIDLLNWCDAKRYFCAKGAFGYMLDDGIFPCEKIEVLFQDFVPKQYAQINCDGSFIPHLSIVDPIMNVGPKETLQLIKGGTLKWQGWDEMKKALKELQGENL